LFFFLLKNTKNSSVATAMQRFFEFFRRKNYYPFSLNLLNTFHIEEFTYIFIKNVETQYFASRPTKA
jgi:hypothetical protein